MNFLSSHYVQLNQLSVRELEDWDSLFFFFFLYLLFFGKNETMVLSTIHLIEGFLPN